MRAGVVVVAISTAGLVACGGEAADPCEPSKASSAVIAVDALTGDVVWERGVGDAISLSVAEDVAAVIGPSGTAAGLDVGTGDTEWCVSVDEGTNALYGFANVGGTFVTPAGGTDLVALDAGSGREVWRREDIATEASFVIAAHGQFFVYDGNAARIRFVVLDTAGADASAVAEPTTLEVGDVTIESEQADTAAVDLTAVRDDDQLWQRTSAGWRPISAADVVIVLDDATSSTDVTAYDAVTGVERWTFTTPAITEQAVGDDDLLAVAYGTSLDVRRAPDGDQLWSGQHRPDSLTERDEDRFLAIELAERDGRPLVIALALSRDVDD